MHWEGGRAYSYTESMTDVESVLCKVRLGALHTSDPRQTLTGAHAEVVLRHVSL